MEMKLIKTWGVSLMLSLAVFAGCLVTIFQPVKMVTESFGSTFTYSDLTGTASMWIKNPNYFATVGITGLLALAGAGWSVYMMNKAGKEE